MKRISPGTVTILVMAILCGLVCAYTVRRYMKVEPPQGVDIVVAGVNLPKYARLSTANLETIQVPVGKVPEGAITNMGRALARLADATIPAGEPITEKSLFPIDAEPMMADKIPAGHRAVAIRVTSDSAIAGVLLPDSLIDISLTAGSNHPELQTATTVTIVRGVKVLATSQQRHRFSENSSRPLRTITVAATPQQANKLTLAQNYGRLTVTLRGSEDIATTTTAPQIANAQNDTIDPYTLLGISPPQPVETKQPVKAQIWRGTTMMEVTFQPQEVSEAKQATIAADHRRDRYRTSFDSKQKKQ